MMNKSRAMYVRFIELLLPYRLMWLTILFLSVLGSFLSLIIPYLTKTIVDTSLVKKDFGSFLIYAVIAGVVFLVGESINWLRYWLEQNIKIKVTFDLNKKVFQHLASLSYAWFQDKKTGEHIFTIHYDIDTVANLITANLPQVISIIPRALLTMTIVFYLDWKMALCALLLGPFLFLPGYFYNRVLEKLSLNMVESSEKVLVVLEQVFSHILLVKVWGTEKRSTRSFLRSLIANVRNSLRYLKPEITNGIAVQIITKAVTGLIALFGGYLVIKGDMSLGSMAAIMVYLTQLVGLQSQLVSLWQMNISSAVSCSRLAGVLDTKPQIIESPDARDLDLSIGAIEFKGVSFGYRPQEFVLKNLSFQIKGGSCVALAGPSGSGKTTILNLLVRLYEQWEGVIRIDSQDTRGVKPRSLKSRIGVALQEHFLWDDTIFNNITYGVTHAESKEVEEIARICGVDDFAKASASGYRTLIGENACKLSEGQKQKIAIARALFKKPGILVLDEAMSAMDSESEEKILANIRERYKDMTIIIVSHRFSTIKGCDRVLYLSAADKITECDIEGLTRNDPGFRSLFAGQLENDQEAGLK
jgi:ATP-binding cassette, subfamily B, bacterial